MPDASISDMIDRTVKQAIIVVSKNGGKLVKQDGKDYLQINENAKFNAPLEFYVGPNPILEVGKPMVFTYYTKANQQYNWKLKSGNLPKGIAFEKGKIIGTPETAGKYEIVLTLDNGKKTIEKSFEILVRTPNIALKADTIYTNVRTLNTAVLDSCWYTFGKPMYATSVSVINDGVLNGTGSVFYSLGAKAKLPKVDYFGYGWKEAKTINMMALHTGCLEEFGGWFTSLNIQYQDENGKWIPVPKYTSTPALPATDIVFFQPHFVEFVFEFEPVRTKAIRILDDTKVQDHWNKYTKNVSAFTSITELSVYEK